MATMIEGMTGVNISSDYFSVPTYLELFPIHPRPPHQYRVALVYGKNGSGKSTIAQGFREFRDSVKPRTVDLIPMINNQLMQDYSLFGNGKVFVFDEEYVSSRVRFRKSGLEAIVLFGDQVDLETQIDDIQRLIDGKQEEVANLATAYALFTNTTTAASPEYWLAKAINKLREDNGWAANGSIIKNLKIKVVVNEATVESIGSISPTKTLTDLLFEMKYRLAQFVGAGKAPTILSISVATIDIDSDIKTNVKVLLEKIVEKPQLKPREIQLLGLFSITDVTNARTFLSSQENAICSKCLQSISDEHRVEVLEGIDRILNRDVDDFTIELKKLLIPEIPITTYHIYQGLPSYGDACARLDEYRQVVISHNSAVQKKIDNPFDAIKYNETIDVMGACDAANDALAKLESDRLNFNRLVDERSIVIQELLTLNDEIGHYAIKEMYDKQHEQMIGKQNAYDRHEVSSDELAALVGEKTRLESALKNIQIAADKINRSLDYVFCCKGRLSLELGSDDVYHLKVNGIGVSPDKVSSGERNVLALCYFFTEITRDMNADKEYSDEIILVVDDPVSSFDIDNRIGILSFLRWKLGLLLDSCPTTKVLLMTHDISVFFDIDKALQEISKHCQQVSVNAEHCLYQIGDKCLSGFQYKRHNEYTQLLMRLHQYAANTTIDNESDMIIGNVMRRVLEAFASFSYKLGIEDVSLNERVLSLLPDEYSKTYYRNLMYRLVLHTESHFEEYIQGAPETSFFSHLSDHEKKRTAKDILCFMYQLNKTHVLSHIPDAEHDLDDWCLAMMSITD